VGEMKKNHLSNLAAAIATRKCTLFSGAGLTASSGGATWDELVGYLKTKFAYESPLQDHFQIMGDMIRKYGGEQIYATIQEKLKNATIANSLIPLVGMPWYAVFTTNYDLALEESLCENQNISIRTIVTGNEFGLSGLDSELLCVKLMGSLDIAYKQPGAMVLDPGDLAVAREQRARIFDTLAAHAANLSFLFTGYSFRDNLFFEIIVKLIKHIGIIPNTYYAVFKDPPDKEREYLFQQYGVKVIISDLSKFAKELEQEVRLQNPKDFTLKRIPMRSSAIPLDVKDISGFLSVFNPVLFEDMEKNIEPYNFLKGDTSSLKPFSLGWHFPRKEIQEVINVVTQPSSIDDTTLQVIKIVGNPGTGRTFVMLAALYELIKNHTTVVIKIPSYAVCPEVEEIDEFIEAVRKSTNLADLDMPEQLVFWADFAMDESVITQFSKIASIVSFPIWLFFEDFPNSHVDIAPADPIHIINVDRDLNTEEKKSLAEYLLDITKKHKLPELNEHETYQIIDEEKRFLPIVYRVLDPARRSINQIIQDELKTIHHPEISHCISICALTSSMDMGIPFSILKKTMEKLLNKSISYNEIFDIINRARAFLQESDAGQNIILIVIYNMLIAQHIVNLLRKDEMDKNLLAIADIVDLRINTEANFISSLLIKKWMNKKPRDFIPFSKKALIMAFEKIRERQPARPILHHLARLYAAENYMHESVMPLLQESLAEPLELYALNERKENILTTLAKVKWERIKREPIVKDRLDSDIREIFELLSQARKSTLPNIHPYDIHARILKELWYKKRKMLSLANEAFEIINEGLSTCTDDLVAKQRLEELEIEWLSEIDQQLAEVTAKELFEERSDGTGYYTLARIEYHTNSNKEKAIQFLNKAKEAKEYPPGVIAFEIELLFKGDDPNYNYLFELVEQLEYDSRFQDYWKSAYYKAIVYTINGKFEEATKLFRISHRMAPFTLQRKVQVFWMEKGHRKIHTGKVGSTLTEREGRIYSHKIKGYRDDIYFDPRRQKHKRALKTGLFVDFELGFSPRGPIAFDVCPHSSQQK